MNTDTYLTIAQPATGNYKNKGSKFFAYAYPVNNEEEIKQHLNYLRKKYFDARHHCYAYRLGADKQTHRANDDGEPTYSAGKPILGQIQSKELTDILIVVVRYFGGTLLGVSGLIEAYKGAAADALNNAIIIEKTDDDIYEILFDFAQMNEVMKIMKEERLKELSRNFDVKGTLTFAVRKNHSDKILAMFNKIYGVTIKKQMVITDRPQ